MRPVDPCIRELAIRLAVGSRALASGRIEATTAELVEGAIQSIRAERTHNSPSSPEALRRKRLFDAGLCVLCGKRLHAPGRAVCRVCSLRDKLEHQRKKGLRAEIRHAPPAT